MAKINPLIKIFKTIKKAFFGIWFVLKLIYSILIGLFEAILFDFPKNTKKRMKKKSDYIQLIDQNEFVNRPQSKLYHDKPNTQISNDKEDIKNSNMGNFFNGF